MDTIRLVETLGLVSGGGLSITDIQMVQWGRDMIFVCRYRTVPISGPPDEPVDFQLIFQDCREVKYKVYAHISAHEEGVIRSVADVVELAFGQGKHRRDANILTNHFGVSISYGSLVVEKDSQRYPIDT